MNSTQPTQPETSNIATLPATPSLRLPVKSFRRMCGFSSSSWWPDTRKASPPTSPPWADSITTASDYIHLYHGNAALLTKSLEVVQRAAALILSAIEASQVEAEEQTEVSSANTTEQGSTTESGHKGLPALSIAHYGDLMRDSEMCFRAWPVRGATRFRATGYVELNITFTV